MPLVEVIRRDGTDARAVATALQFVKALRKTPVLVKNREGFLVNRLFVPYAKEAFRLLEEGADAPAVDAAMVEFGFPMGPLAVIDAAGVDILVRSDAGRRARAITTDEITDRLVMRLVSEAFRVMGEGIAQRESDLDVAMVLGTGFPDFRGGVLRYARDLGLGHVLPRLTELSERFGERFAPCEFLRRE
jgi:3-hydroxyacyl-CoA dehydrogenase